VTGQASNVWRAAAAALIGALAITVTAGFSPASAAPVPTPSSTHAAADSDRAVREHFRLTGSVDHTISPNADNYASRTIQRSPLLLFLPATGHHPSQYRDFLSAARETGYHVLALDYWNTGRSVERTCGVNSACYTEVQRNRLDGSEPTRFSSVNPANSIVNRLRVSLRHLQRVDPAGRWQQYVTGSAIDWANIVVAGHSQGGGEAAYISHIHAVRGVLMFSSPVDSDNGVNASWMSSSGATPASRMYGFDDSSDIFNQHVLASWSALGMGTFGAVANAAAPIPAGSHELVTYRDLGTPGQAHLRNITDGVPIVQGKPVFEGVWKWMLEQPYQRTASSIASIYMGSAQQSVAPRQDEERSVME
jgi:Alpha/beta hydrolase family